MPDLVANGAIVLELVGDEKVAAGFQKLGAEANLMGRRMQSQIKQMGISTKDLTTAQQLQLEKQLKTLNKTWYANIRHNQLMWRMWGHDLQMWGSMLTRWVTIPMGVAGVVAGVMAYNFNTAMTKVQALTGATAEEMDKYTEKVMNLSRVSGVMPKELAEGLYFIASSGFRGREALDILTQSTRLAAAGMGEMRWVAESLTSAMTAWKTSNLTAASAADTLVAAVREGKAEPDEFARSLGRVIPIASQVGIKFSEVGAAIASVTRIGMSARISTFGLRQLLTSFMKPQKPLIEGLKSIGLTVKGVTKDMTEKGFLPAMRDIYTHAKGSAEKISKMFTINAATIFLALMRDYQGTKGVFDRLTKEHGDTMQAFLVTMASPAAKFRKALADLAASAIEFGNSLLPIFTTIIMGIAGIVGPIVKSFAQMSAGFQVFIGILLMGIGPVMKFAGAIVTMATSVASARYEKALRDIGLVITQTGMFGGAVVEKAEAEAADTIAMEANSVATTEMAAAERVATEAMTESAIASNAAAGAQERLAIANQQVAGTAAEAALAQRAAGAGSTVTAATTTAATIAAATPLVPPVVPRPIPTEFKIPQPTYTQIPIFNPEVKGYPIQSYKQLPIPPAATEQLALFEAEAYRSEEAVRRLAATGKQLTIFGDEAYSAAGQLALPLGQLRGEFTALEAGALKAGSAVASAGTSIGRTAEIAATGVMAASMGVDALATASRSYLSPMTKVTYGIHESSEALENLADAAGDAGRAGPGVLKWLARMAAPGAIVAGILAAGYFIDRFLVNPMKYIKAASKEDQERTLAVVMQDTDNVVRDWAKKALGGYFVVEEGELVWRPKDFKVELGEEFITKHVNWITTKGVRERQALALQAQETKVAYAKNAQDAYKDMWLETENQWRDFQARWKQATQTGEYGGAAPIPKDVEAQYKAAIAKAKAAFTGSMDEVKEQQAKIDKIKEKFGPLIVEARITDMKASVFKFEGALKRIRTALKTAKGDVRIDLRVREQEVLDKLKEVRKALREYQRENRPITLRLRIERLSHDLTTNRNLLKRLRQDLRDTKDEKIKVQIQLDIKQAEKRRDELMNKLRTLRGKAHHAGRWGSAQAGAAADVVITADNTQALSTVAETQAAIDGMKDGNVTIWVTEKLRHRDYAAGGIVYAPTYAHIGEAGPEAVIPLSQPKRAYEILQQVGLTSSQTSPQGNRVESSVYNVNLSLPQGVVVSDLDKFGRTMQPYVERGTLLAERRRQRGKA